MSNLLNKIFASFKTDIEEENLSDEITDEGSFQAHINECVSQEKNTKNSPFQNKGFLKTDEMKHLTDNFDRLSASSSPQKCVNKTHFTKSNLGTAKGSRERFNSEDDAFKIMNRLG